MKLLFTFILILILPVLSSAVSLNFNRDAIDYTVDTIAASQVKGVSIRLSQTVVHKDCNLRALHFHLAYSEGTRDSGWSQTDQAIVSTKTTPGTCSSKKTIKEKIFSNRVFVKSLTNEKLDGEVLLTLIVPSEYDVEVTEVQ